MDDSIKNQSGDSSSGSNRNGPVTSPLDNLVVPDPASKPPDLAPLSPQPGQPEPSASPDTSLDNLASQALQDIHAATNKSTDSVSSAQTGSEPVPPPPANQSTKQNEMDIQNSLNSLVQSASPDATPSTPDTSSVSVPDSPHDATPTEQPSDLPEHVPDSFSTQDQQTDAGAFQGASQNEPVPPPPSGNKTVPGSLVIPDPPDQKTETPSPADAPPGDPPSKKSTPGSLVVPDQPAETDTAAHPNQESVPESLVVPDSPPQKSGEQPTTDIPQPDKTSEKLTVPPGPTDGVQPGPPETPPLPGDVSTVTNPPQTPPAGAPMPETAGAPPNPDQPPQPPVSTPPQQPVQTKTPPGPTLPDLPANAEISVDKDKTPPTQMKKKPPGGGKPPFKIPGKNILALGAVLFFLVGLGISIPAINQQMTLSNRASEPQGAQSCYQPCDFTSNLCRDGLVCGAVQKCDEENPDQCEKQNLCYNPQCKENNTCNCAQESSSQTAKTPPTAQRSDSAVCSFDTRTAVQVDDQLIESIVSNGLFWNYNENGELWEGSAAKGSAITSVDRYAKGPCKGQASCQFDTRTTYQQGEEIIESITVGNRLWNYDSEGNLWGGTTEEGTKLTDIPHYAEGPCQGKDECWFDTRTVTVLNGQRVESITIENKYWNYDENANPLAGTSKEGNDLTAVTRYAEGPCKDTDPCYFDTRTFFPDGEDMIETITVGNRLWNYDPSGQLWEGTNPDGIELTSVEQYISGPCGK